MITIGEILRQQAERKGSVEANVQGLYALLTRQPHRYVLALRKKGSEPRYNEERLAREDCGVPLSATRHPEITLQSKYRPVEIDSATWYLVHYTWEEYD